jgi:2-C-methyl-D-erythritol 4-phosphate cytidylyltransferase
MKPRRYFALIPAAGIGARMGADVPKQYLPIAGKPMLRHASDAFLASPAIAHVFIVVSANDAWADDVFSPGTDRVSLLCCGGATRRDSVLNGLRAMEEQLAADDWVLVHDAARPGLTPELIEKLIVEVGDDPVGGLLALPVADTVKRVDSGRVGTIPRDGLWLAQTPQMFPYAVLRKALQENAGVTDEANAIESIGLVPKLVEGHVRNSKVTQPSDVMLVEMFLV